VEDKDNIKDRIGRSPDAGEAVMMALCPRPAGLPKAQPKQQSKFNQGDRVGQLRKY
jgi:hypothetical protein